MPPPSPRTLWPWHTCLQSGQDRTGSKLRPHWAFRLEAPADLGMVLGTLIQGVRSAPDLGKKQVCSSLFEKNPFTDLAHMPACVTITSLQHREQGETKKRATKKRGGTFTGCGHYRASKISHRGHEYQPSEAPRERLPPRHLAADCRAGTCGLWNLLSSRSHSCFTPDETRAVPLSHQGFQPSIRATSVSCFRKRRR